MDGASVGLADGFRKACFIVGKAGFSSQGVFGLQKVAVFVKGVAAAVIIGMVLGIQFITAGVSGQAKVKEKLIPYGVGCVVAFGAFGIWKVVINVMYGIF